MRPATTEVELAIGGMTCASCAARVEKKLNRMDGVAATVNYATEKARVTFADGVTPADLVATVARTGYTAELPKQDPPPTDVTDNTAEQPDPAVASLRRRMLVTAALTVPVLALSMVPALQFNHWQWLALTLATPVVIWGAWPFHRAALTALRHGGSTMDTLVSLGISAAFGWSLNALFHGGADDQI